MIEGHHALYTKKGWLVFSETPLAKSHVIKSNKLLGLYLVSGKPSQTKINVYNRFPKEVALITPYSIRPNTIISESFGVESLGKLKKIISAPFAIMGRCCSLRGFNSSKGVVTSEWIKTFLERKDSRVGSVGVRFKQSKKGIIVKQKNPFIKYNGLRVGDVILTHNKKKVSLDTLEKRIALGKIGSMQTFKITRAGKVDTLKVSLKERLGGGVLGDTFLEFLGLSFNQQLEVIAVKKNSLANKLKLLPQDKIILLDGKRFTHDKELRAYLSTYQLPKERLELLIQRDGLQIFIYIPRHELKI